MPLNRVLYVNPFQNGGMSKLNSCLNLTVNFFLFFLTTFKMRYHDDKMMGHYMGSFEATPEFPIKKTKQSYPPPNAFLRW